MLAKMPANYTYVLTNSDKSYLALATLINVKIGTVRSRLHRARTMLVKLRAQRDMEPPSN